MRADEGTGHGKRLADLRTSIGTRRTGSVVPPAARAVLKRFDEHSQHYEWVAHHSPTQVG